MTLLAQAVEAAQEGRLFGLSVVEWGMLLGFLATFITSIASTLKASKGGKKVEAIVKALEEAGSAHPEAAVLIKRLAKEKATQLGVETGRFGLGQDVTRLTQRLSPDKALGPDDPTPNPDEASP